MNSRSTQQPAIDAAMSSVTGLGRSRSLRKPTTNGNEQAGKSSDDPSRSEARIASPSRLPQVRQGMRSAAATATTTTSSTVSRPPSAGASSSTRTTARTRAPSSTSRPPLSTSSVFAARTTATARRASPTTDSAPKTTTKATTTTTTRARAPSIRQVTASTTSGVRNAASAARPTSSSGTTSSSTTGAKTLAHSRAKSTATTLTPATTLRPPSSNSSAAKTSSNTVSSQTTTSKPPSRSQTHTRHLSQPSTSTSHPTATTSATSAAVSHKPAFNTNQQHYSPLKSHAPKPLTSTYLAPPSPSKLPANVAISAETSRLQAELLQLSLLHRDAAVVTAEWHASAWEKLGARFGQLVKGNDELSLREREAVEGRNVASLARWGQGRLDEKVLGLDEVIAGLWSLSEPGGRYARVVVDFEEWAGRVEAIVTSQRAGQAGQFNGNEEDALFVSDLKRPWKRDCASLVRKLQVLQTKLVDLGPAAAEEKERSDEEADRQRKSSIAKVLSACSSLVDDMLAELAIMARIEQEALSAELEWIEKMNDELRLDDTQDNEIPLWKTLV